MNPPVIVSFEPFFLDASHCPDKCHIDWQPSQLVGFPGRPQIRDSERNQHFERRTLSDTDTDLLHDPDLIFAIRPLTSL